MCDIGKAISRAFSFGSGHAATALMEQQAEAQNAATAAEDAMSKAIKDMNAAAVPAIDSPSAQAAQKAAMARALGAQGAAWSFGGAPTAAPVTGTKVLLGQ